MAIAAVASAHGKFVGNTTSGNIDTRTSDFLALVVSCSNTALPTISDNQGNTLTLLFFYQDGALTTGTGIYYCFGPTTSATHTFTMAGGVTAELYIQGFSGMVGKSFDKRSGVANTANVLTLKPGNLTPANDNSLWIMGWSNCCPTNSTVDSGFTKGDDDVFNSGVNYNGGISYLIQGAAANLDPAVSWGSNAANQQAATLAIFNAATLPPRAQIIEI